MSIQPTFSFTEPIVEPDILASIESLPTEDELPCDDGEPMETAQHRDQMWKLIYSLQFYWADRTDYYVGGNMFIHYDPENHRRFRGPDFFLVMDVENRKRKSWVVWREGMRFPDVIIELLSDSTRTIDASEKKTLYERVFRTAEYYLYDPFSQEFLGYHLQGAHYAEAQPDIEGKIYSPVTGLFLAVRDEWLRWLTPEGAVIFSPEEIVPQERQRADTEQQRANAEQQRANAEQQRADAEQQRADAEQQRADAEQQHAATERQRAEAERQRAEEAERLLETYRRRFGSLE
jgi:Uma2 family endonuclease